MIDDDPQEEAQRRIMRQADEDVGAFLSALDQDEVSGIPPPPQIRVSEVALHSEDSEFVPWGGQGAGTQPAPFHAPFTPPPGCSASNTGATNHTDLFNHIDLTLRVYGHTETNCDMGGPPDTPEFWTFDETFTKNLTREDRNLVSPVRPDIDHFQLWTDTLGFEHLELSAFPAQDCFNCFGGWDSCTAAFEVGGFMGELVNLCPGGYAPEDSGQTWFVAAQFTWFNSSGVPGWSDGNELQFYYYSTQFYECNSGSPDFLTCNGIGMNPGFVPFDSETGKALADLPGTYFYTKTLLDDFVPMPSGPDEHVYLYYEFTIDIYT